MNGPRLYTEPEPTIAHLYEQRGDGFWYPKATPVNTGCACTINAELENENRRMITAFEAIASIANDMLDPVRRAGPTSKREEKSQ